MKIYTAAEYDREKSNLTGGKDADLDQRVLDIISRVQTEGDEALKSYTAQFDGVTIDVLRVSEAEFTEAETQVSSEFNKALQTARKNITSFHEKQKEQSWFSNETEGVMLGQKVTPLARVGVYVPGGTAVYPSTVLMDIIPAQIAGVPNIIVTTPPQPDGTINPHILVACAAAGVKEVYKVGGAQAIAALAYGTESIDTVVKIVGPGNAYVACAKKWVYGDVAIDMIAGPSEVCIVTDETAIPKYVAADLLSQAEHDENATALCITTSSEFANDLQTEIATQMEQLERRDIVEKSIAHNGAIVIVATLDEAYTRVNKLAPEHLQIMTKNPLEQVQHIQNAGAIFLGHYSPEALGDYVAGPNHTLPTNGTAAFSSPLGVYDFMKKTSIIHYSKEALETVSDDIITLANAEGLQAHALSIEKRKGDLE